MKNSKTVCIYHGGCLDGFTSAWIVHKAIPDAVFIAGHYNSPIDLHMLEGKQVIFVDFSVKRPQMVDIANVASNVIVLDHHKSAEAELEGLSDKYNNVEVVFDMDKSGAGITWDYFFKEEAPFLVKTVEDRDLWKFELAFTKEITAYMFTLDQTFEVWDTLDKTTPSELAAYGSILLTKFNKDVADLIRSGAREMIVDDHKVMVINVPWLYASEVGNQLVKEHPFSLMYYINNDGKYSCSLRADGKYDCSKLASKYGGGGHANAAGFTVDEPIWIPCEANTKIFEVKGFREYKGYDKVWFEVEASSKEEALALVKESPDEYEVSSKGIDIGDSEYIDQASWEVH